VLVWIGLAVVIGRKYMESEEEKRY
jgi:hypothetical protein